jgi:DNA-directed RNA polymerase subunit L/cation transport regulator ChaB
MFEYKEREIQFTINVSEYLLPILLTDNQEKLNEAIDKSLNNANISVRFAKQFSQENDLATPMQHFHDMVQYMLTEEEPELAVNFVIFACFPCELTEGLKHKLQLKDQELYDALFKRCFSNYDNKAFKRPVNLEIEPVAYHVDHKSTELKGNNVLIRMQLCFNKFSKTDIEKYRKKSFVGSFVRDKMRIENKNDHTYRFKTSENSWRSSEYRLWECFPPDAVYLGSYVYLENPGLLELRPSSDFYYGPCNFSLYFKEKQDMDIEQAIESAAGRLFDGDDGNKAYNILSMLAALSDDPRINKFANIEFGSGYVGFTKHASSWDSNIYFNFGSSWNAPNAVLRDCERIIKDCQGVIEMFTALTETVIKIEESKSDLPTYIQGLFKKKMKENPLMFSGDMMTVNNEYARLKYTSNPIIADLANLFLSKVDEMTYVPPPPLSDVTQGDKGTWTTAITIYDKQGIGAAKEFLLSMDAISEDDYDNEAGILDALARRREYYKTGCVPYVSMTATVMNEIGTITGQLYHGQ